MSVTSPPCQPRTRSKTSTARWHPWRSPNARAGSAHRGNEFIQTSPPCAVAAASACPAFRRADVDHVAFRRSVPAQPTVGRDLSASAGAMQLTLSAFLPVLPPDRLFYGTLSDRFGRMIPLVFGLLLYVTASIACALATDVAALIALRFVQALGACAAAPCSRERSKPRAGARRPSM